MTSFPSPVALSLSPFVTFVSKELLLHNGGAHAGARESGCHLRRDYGEGGEQWTVPETVQVPLQHFPGRLRVHAVHEHRLGHECA